MVNRDPILLQLYARASAPRRDYYGLTLTEKEVILNIWNISHGPHIYPKRHKCPLAEFRDDKILQEQIRDFFGLYALEYTLQLASQQRNLQFMSSKIFLFILRHLAANDILNLSQTSKIFFELCNTEPVWKILFRKRTKRRIAYEDLKQAERSTWKSLLKNKFCKKSCRNINNVPHQTNCAVGRKPNVLNNVKTQLNNVCKLIPAKTDSKIMNKVQNRCPVLSTKQINEPKILVKSLNVPAPKQTNQPKILVKQLNVSAPKQINEPKILIKNLNVPVPKQINEPKILIKNLNVPVPKQINEAKTLIKNRNMSVPCKEVPEKILAFKPSENNKTSKAPASKIRHSQSSCAVNKIEIGTNLNASASNLKGRSMTAVTKSVCKNVVKKVVKNKSILTKHHS